MASKRTEVDWHSRNRTPTAMPGDPRSRIAQARDGVETVRPLGTGKGAVTWPSGPRTLPYPTRNGDPSLSRPASVSVGRGDPFRPKRHAHPYAEADYAAVKGEPRARIDATEGHE